MNLNNFVVLPSKSKSMKLNVRNVRELRMETVQLAQQTKDMENRLEELRERMCQEKEEREKSGASHWRSALSAGLAPGFQSAKMNKENQLSPGKMKIRVLKDEPVPVVQKPLVVEPANKAKGANRKLRLRGKVCGQCEVQLAGLMCSECGEDYCVGCFVRFHQKGALKHHRMIPVQAELQTPVSTRDVLGHLQQQVTGEESQPTQGAVHKSADEREATEQRPAAKNILPMSDNLTHHTQPQVLFVNDGVDVEDEEGAEKEESSLLRGFYDEEESARSFQMALQEWRDKRPITARPASIMGTQTERRSQHHIHVEFKEDMLSYMEKLLLKKHRRGQIEEFQSQSFVYRRPDPSTSPPTETDELSQKLTTEQMELRKYFTSLFTIAPAEDAGRVDSPAESYLSIVELDEMVGEVATHRSFAAEPENENKMTEKENGDGEFGCRVVTSTPSLSELTRGSCCEHNSVTEIWPPSQETDQFSSHLPRPETSPPLQTRLQISQHLSATSASSETFLLNSPRGEQKVEHSSKITLSTPLCESPKPRTRFYHLPGLHNVNRQHYSSLNEVQNLHVLHPQGLSCAPPQ
ncbi:zinc finger B-box domain-containing protein 1-like [Myxocyprinus asiaticus]|uniref:zinc finger B-box domain-containing protein 1-like n=1 Tax=Myxocyprinus asiaticus TaxID=70543 RepID=UPI00222277B6|nr:zinc finger B-box domain-containing protein 1-like [Myxocyprinus asiaticus]